MKNKLSQICDNMKNICSSASEKISDKRKFLLFVLCALIVIYLMLSLIPFLFSVIVGHRIEISDKEIVSETSASGYLYAYKNQLFFFDSNGMQFYGYNGDYKNTLYLDAYEPYTFINDDIIAVADTNGKNGTVIKNNKIRYTVKTQENIQLVTVNNGLYSCVITNEKGYKSLVKVYNNRGENIYEWHIGEYYAVDAYVTDNNKYLAVLCVGIDENTINSHVVFIDLKEEKVHGEFIIENELAYKFKLLNNDAYAVTDKGVYRVSTSGKLRQKYSFYGKELLGFDIDDCNNISIALNENNSQSLIVVLDKRLKSKNECNIPIRVTMFDSVEDKVVAAGQNEVFVTSKGRIYAKGVFSKEADTVVLSDDGKHIATSSGRGICTYKLRLGR